MKKRAKNKVAFINDYWKHLKKAYQRSIDDIAMGEGKTTCLTDPVLRNFDIIIKDGLEAFSTAGYKTGVKILSERDDKHAFEMIDALKHKFTEKYECEKVAFVILTSFDDDEIASLGELPTNFKVFGSSFTEKYKHLIRVNSASVLSDKKEEDLVDNEPAIKGLSLEDLHIHPDEMKEQEEYYVSFLRHMVHDNRLALFLGNGISLAYGSDSWPETTKGILSYLSPTLVKNINKTSSLIGENAYSEMHFAKFAFSTKLPTGDNYYYKAIHNSIYHKFLGLYPTGTTLHGVTKLFRKTNCEVITFNFDSFLEQDFAYTFAPLSASSEYDGHLLKDAEPYVIKHVHGFLPPDYSTITPEMKKSIVFGEDEYLNFYIRRSPKPWGYQEIVKAINEKCCLCIGLSLTDLYLRSLFLKGNQEQRHLLILADEELGVNDRLIINDYFNELNVKILWFDSYDQVTPFLDTL